MTYIDLLIIYAIGIVICTVIISAFEDWTADDILGMWITASLWPILGSYHSIVFASKLPYWIGRGIKYIIKG